MDAQRRHAAGRVAQPIKIPIKVFGRLIGCRSLAPGSLLKFDRLLVSLVIQREYSRSRLDRFFDRLHTLVRKTAVCRSNDQEHGGLIGWTLAGA